MSDEVHRCAKEVPSPGMTMYFHPCHRNGVHYENDKWWCRQHAPSIVAAKNAARHAKCEAKWKADKQKQEEKKLREARRDACERACAGLQDPEATIKDLVRCVTAYLQVHRYDVSQDVARPARSALLDVLNKFPEPLL